MSTTNGERGRPPAALVLPTVFAEHWVDRRVLLVGEISPEGRQRILSGCKALRVLDTGVPSRGATRARIPERKNRSYRVSPYRPGPLGFQPGAFDVALIPEVAVFGEEGPERIGDLTRILDGGLLLVGTAAARGIAYETFYGWLSAHFAHVRLFGEAPFEGVAVADFEAGPVTEVVVDGSLAERDRSPRAFFALASDTPIDDAPAYTIVELPGALEAEGPSSREVADLEAAVEHAEELEAEVERLRVSLEQARRELEGVATARVVQVPAPAIDRQAVEEAQREAAREIDALEARLVERAQHVQALEAEIERRGLLVRDVVEEARGLRHLGGGDPNAVERALVAEAARAEAQFQVDELRAQLRECLEGRADATPTKSIEIDAYESRIRALSASEERLSARVGELSNQLIAAQDLAASLAAATPTTDVEIERRSGRELGLRLRLANVERAFAARAVEARRGAAAVDTVDALRAEVAAIQAENSALTIQLADLRDSEGELRSRAGDLTSALAARDALVTRLQLELSQLEQQTRRAEQRASRIEDEAKGLRAALVDAAAAVEERERAQREVEGLRQQLDELRDRARQLEADRFELEERAQRSEGERSELTDRVARLDGERAELEGRVSALEAELRGRVVPTEATVAHDAAAEDSLLSMEAELEVLRAHAEALENERDEARAILAETREALEGLRSGQGLEGQAAPESGHEHRDRDLLFRSLTAQLEERNDRIRALERRLSGSIPAAPPNDELMRRQLLELQERSVRLAEELSAERDARRTVESRLVEFESRPELDEELRRVREELSRNRHELDLEKSRAEGFERDVCSLREVCVEARHGLESLLGEATLSGDQETADRIGRLLTVLGRY